MQRRIALILGPLLFILVQLFLPFEGLSEQGHAVGPNVRFAGYALEDTGFSDLLAAELHRGHPLPPNLPHGHSRWRENGTNRNRIRHDSA